METAKKKRCPNYTQEEKENFFSLVTKYKSIIDCKRTGAYYIQKKKEAWVAICKEYNSLSTTGPRDEAMLKHFYNNIKHRARKVTASTNKQRYLSEPTVETITVDETVQIPDIKPGSSHSIDDSVPISEVEIKDLQMKWIDEKKNIKKTGGGSYDPILSEADHQILSIMDDHIHPDENIYDDAAEYFGETVELPVEDSLITIQTDEVQNDKTTLLKYSVPVVKNKTSLSKNSVPEMKNKTTKYSVPVVKKKYNNNQFKQDFKNKSVELLRKIYFKKKIELVFYQKKNEMQKFRYEKIKQDLQVKILKKQLEEAVKDNTS